MTVTVTAPACVCARSSGDFGSFFFKTNGSRCHEIMRKRELKQEAGPKHAVAMCISDERKISHKTESLCRGSRMNSRVVLGSVILYIVRTFNEGPRLRKINPPRIERIDCPQLTQ